MSSFGGKIIARRFSTFATISATSGLLQRSNLGLLDHLVGTAEQRRWHGEAERLGRSEVEDQRDPGGLLDRQVNRGSRQPESKKEFNVFHLQILILGPRD